MTSKFDAALDAFRSGDLGRARSLAEQGLQSSPSAELEHLVGLIECRQGRLADGVDWLARACRSDPSNAAFKVMLGRALVDSGRAREALDAAAAPAGSTPPEIALWHVRAEAADACGDDPASVEAWGGFCRSGAGDWSAWRNYASALARCERWPEASRALRKAVEMDPSRPELRRLLATALAESGDHDEAANVLKTWVESEPDRAESRIHLARLFADLGRDEECVEQLDSMVREATGRGFEESGEGLVAAATGTGGQVKLSLLVEIGRLLERTNRIDALRTLLSEAGEAGIAKEQLAFPAASVALRDGEPKTALALLERSDPGEDPLRWHRLKAMISDSLDQPEAAFAAAEAMNLSVPDRDKWVKAASDYVASVRSVAAAVTDDWAARVRPLDPSGRKSPVFLVGFPRSGTTLLDTFLMGHPRVRVLEEVPLMAKAQRSLGSGDGLPDRSMTELEAARALYFEGLDANVEAGFDGLVVDKLPLNMLASRFIHVLFPDARIVFAQRHPCDCVLSGFMQPFALNESMACFLDLELAASFYDAAMTTWTRCCETLPLNVHTVVYEDLVADPESSLRPLVDFLGLEWDGTLLDHRSTAEARGAISTPSYDQVVQPLTNRPSGRWRRYEKQMEPVLPVLLPWAERLGYGE